MHDSGTQKYPRTCKVLIYPHTDASQPLLTGQLLSFQLLFVQFESEKLVEKAGPHQIRESRHQHRTSSDVDGGVQVSVQRLHDFIDAG